MADQHWTPPPTPSVWATPPPPPPKRKRYWLRATLIVLGAIVMISVIATVAGGGSDTPTKAPAGTNAPVRSVPDVAVNDDTITMAEFNTIATDMTLAEVEDIIGGPGELLSHDEIAGITGDIYAWYGESPGANANVQFQDGFEVGKAQFGLE